MLILSETCINRKIKFVVYFIPQEAFGAVADIVAHVTSLQAISFHSPSVYA